MESNCSVMLSSRALARLDDITLLSKKQNEFFFPKKEVVEAGRWEIVENNENCKQSEELRYRQALV